MLEPKALIPTQGDQGQKAMSQSREVLAIIVIIPAPGHLEPKTMTHALEDLALEARNQALEGIGQKTTPKKNPSLATDDRHKLCVMLSSMKTHAKTFVLLSTT